MGVQDVASQPSLASSYTTLPKEVRQVILVGQLLMGVQDVASQPSLARLHHIT